MVYCIIELNELLPLGLYGFHDIYSPSGKDGGPVPIVDVIAMDSAMSWVAASYVKIVK